VYPTTERKGIKPEEGGVRKMKGSRKNDKRKRMISI
jgi:hypothetical protein